MVELQNFLNAPRTLGGGIKNNTERLTLISCGSSSALNVLWIVRLRTGLHSSLKPVSADSAVPEASETAAAAAATRRVVDRKLVAISHKQVTSWYHRAPELGCNITLHAVVACSVIISVFIRTIISVFISFYTNHFYFIIRGSSHK